MYERKLCGKGEFPFMNFLPVFGKSNSQASKFIGIVYRELPDILRYGSLTRQTYSLIKRSELWSKEQLQEYQLTELKYLIDHAYRTVPFYSRVMNERGIHPKAIQDFEDLKMLPIVSKREMRQNLGSFISTQFGSDRLQAAHTGSSSGQDFQFYYEKYVSLAKEKAFFRRMFERFGSKRQDRIVVIKGDKSLSEKIQFNPLNNTLYICNPVIAYRNIQQYAEIIKDFNPHSIKGYPSYIFGLAHYLQIHSIDLNLTQLKYIFCYSEQLHEFQHHAIREYFQVNVFSQYSMSESCVFMETCTSHNDYHVLPQYGYTEIIPDTGNNHSAGIGRVIATGFNNYAFPFIRYDTEDYATLPRTEYCTCGREYQIVNEIIGRSNDFIITKSGDIIFPTTFDDAAINLENYLDLMIVQHETDFIEILLVPDDNYTSSDGKFYLTLLKKVLPDTIHLKLSIVDVIERTPANKRLFVYSHLHRQLINQSNSNRIALHQGIKITEESLVRGRIPNQLIQKKREKRI
jgi:phenylacetate-CoA ligase